MPSTHLIFWCPLLLSIFPSIKDFSNKSAVHIRWTKYCSFSFSISPSSEYSGFISLKIDWFDLFAVLETFRSLQQHSTRASILWHPAFFMVQLSQHYKTTGKTIALTILCWQNNLCFSTQCLGLSSLSCQERIIFWFHGCSHQPQWFWSPRRQNLSQLLFFPLLLAMQ